MEPLVAGGAAEAFERQIHQLFRGGDRNPGGVRMLDRAGIRQLVRGQTTGQRVGGTRRLASAPAEVATVLDRLSGQVMEQRAGVKSVACELPRRERA